MRRFFPSTLSIYLARIYSLSFLQLLGILLAIVYLFDTVELLRRAAKVENVPLSLILEMGLLKLPDVGQTILPFAVLFSALYTFWVLVRRHELVIVRAAGLSVWQFLGPVVAVGIFIGLFHMMVINPFGAVLISRYHALENMALQTKTNTVSVGEQGLWLRQKTEDGSVILRAGKVRLPEWSLTDVTAFFFSKDGTFAKRIDAKNAILQQGKWVFVDVTLNTAGKLPEKTPSETLVTSITPGEIEKSFSTAEQTPFWKLPAYIRTMEATGFDSRQLKIHFQTLLAQPVLFAAMVVLAATVSLRSTRFQNTGLMMGTGVVLGFLVFFVSSFLKALGASDQIPVLLAAWFPSLIALILGISVILTTEDG